MIIPPPTTPAERFASVLCRLSQAVAAQTLGGPLSLRLIALVGTRIIRAIHTIFAIAALVAAGRYAPRKPPTAPRQRGAPRRPPPPPPADPAPKTVGWLVPLLPYGGAHREQLRELLSDPEMVALMAAAPVPIGRVLRPLCWMLALDLPPALKRPRPAAENAPPPDPAGKPRTAPRRRPRAPPPPPRIAPAAAPPALTLEYSLWGPPRLVWS